MLAGAALASGPAAAQDLADEQAGDQALGEAPGALPGLVRVGAGGPMDTGLVLSALAGYGYLGGVLDDNDSHQRAAMDLAASWRPIRWLAIAARFTGRYDRHRGAPEGADESWVGDPRLTLRAALPSAGSLGLAVQLGAWMPGEEMPSLAPAATTVDALALATLAPGGGALALSAQAGGRIDRSAESAPDAGRLSASDRMALGVSESSAVLLGAGARLRLARTEILAEWTWDLLVGEDAPDPGRSPMRVGLGLRQPLGDSLALYVSGELSLAEARALEPMEPLYPVEPRISAMAGLTMHLGRRAPDRIVVVTPPDDDAVEEEVVTPPPPTTGTVELTVTGEGGAPLAGVTVELQPAEGSPRTATTGEDGRAVFDDVPGGAATATLRHPEHQEATRAIEAVPGETARAEASLDKLLPPGQLRGVVRAFNGKPLAARLTIAPLGTTVQADARGEFEIDLPPGSYEVEVEASGFKPQTRSIVIQQDEVVILNVDLRQ